MSLFALRTAARHIHLGDAMDQDRLTALERRVQELEDVIAITRAAVSYGPFVDGDLTREATELWVEDGEYSTEFIAWHGRGEIVDMLDSDMCVANREAGCSHMISAPRVTVNGDRAVATAYMSFIQRVDDKFLITRHDATVFDFVRTPDGWKVDRRANRLMDGSAESRSLLARGVTDSHSPS
jgi:hypothetical protein